MGLGLLGKRKAWVLKSQWSAGTSGTVGVNQLHVLILQAGTLRSVGYANLDPLTLPKVFAKAKGVQTITAT